MQKSMRLRQGFILVTLMLIGEGVFILPFLITRLFRPTFLEVFGMTNFQLGSAFSVYGIVAMVSYFLGGPIADKYPPKKLLIFSLIITGIGGILMGLIPSIAMLTVLYGFWGLSTVLFFWAAFIKAVRQFGGEETQGRSHGLVDAGRGLMAVALASSSVFLLDAFLPSDVSSATTQEKTIALGYIIWVFSAVVLLCAVLVWVLIPKVSKASHTLAPKLTAKGLKEVMANRTVWLQSFIVLCAYVGYKCTDDFGLYAFDVLGYNDVQSAHMATISFWMRPIGALLAGLLGDRIGHSKMTGFSFIVVLLGALCLSSGLLKLGGGAFVAIAIASTSLGIYGLRGLYFALFQESRISLTQTGTAIGVVSVLGYTPDIFMGPFMGYLLDHNPGELGHQYVFAVLGVFSLVGFVVSRIFYRQVKTQH
jgi:MFS family permease